MDTEGGRSMQTTSIEERQDFEAKVLEDSPRLTRKDTFRFACHPGVSCFGDCCGDVNIFLTPKDVLRLKNRLGMTSGEFLEKHTILPGDGNRSMPAPVLQMKDDEKKRCPFLGDEGCSVYADRPWACRMYPLGFAAPPEGSDEEPFFFLVKEGQCHGFEEDREVAIEDWLAGQDVEEGDDGADVFRLLAGGDRIEKWKEEDPRKVQMFFMATYDVDTFRRFVFETSLLRRIDIPEEEKARMRTDDEALLAFSYRWLRFSLFGERTLNINKDAKA